MGLLFSFSGAAGLLVADAVIYGMATVGAGLADGWASKAAIPNTHFSNESPGDNSFMASQLTPRNLPRKPFPRNSRPDDQGLLTISIGFPLVRPYYQNLISAGALRGSRLTSHHS